MAKLKVSYTSKEKVANSSLLVTSLLGARNGSFERKFANTELARIAPEWANGTAAAVFFGSNPEIRNKLVARPDVLRVISVIRSASDSMFSAFDPARSGLFSLAFVPAEKQGKEASVVSKGALIGNPLAHAAFLACNDHKGLSDVEASALITLGYGYVRNMIGSDGSDVDASNAVRDFAHMCAEERWSELATAIRNAGSNAKGEFAGEKSCFKTWLNESLWNKVIARHNTVCGADEHINARQRAAFTALYTDIFSENMPAEQIKTDAKHATVWEEVVRTLIVCAALNYHDIAKSLRGVDNVIDKLESAPIEDVLRFAVSIFIAQVSQVDVNAKGGFVFPSEVDASLGEYFDGFEGTNIGFYDQLVRSSSTWYAQHASLYAKAYGEYMKSVSKDLMTSAYAHLFLQYRMASNVQRFLDNLPSNIARLLSDVPRMIQLSCASANDLRNAVGDAKIEAATSALESQVSSLYPGWESLVTLSQRSGRGDNVQLAFLADQAMLAIGSLKPAGSDEDYLSFLTGGILKATVASETAKRLKPYVAITGAEPTQVKVQGLINGEAIDTHDGSFRNPTENVICTLIDYAGKAVAGQSTSKNVFRLDPATIFRMLMVRSLTDDTVRANVRSGAWNTFTAAYDWSRNVKDSAGLKVSQYFSAISVIASNARRSQYISGAMALAYVRAFYGGLRKLPDDILSCILSSHADGEDVTAKDRLDVVIDKIDMVLSAIAMTDDDRKYINELAAADGVESDLFELGYDHESFNVCVLLNDVLSMRVVNSLNNLAAYVIALENARDMNDVVNIEHVSDLPVSILGGAAGVPFGSTFEQPENITRLPVTLGNADMKALIAFIQSNADEAFHANCGIAFDLQDTLSDSNTSVRNRIFLPHRNIAGMSDIAGDAIVARIVARDVRSIVSRLSGDKQMGRTLSERKFVSKVKELGMEALSLMRLNPSYSVTDTLGLKTVTVNIGFGFGEDTLETLLNAIGLSRLTQIADNNVAAIHDFVNAMVKDCHARVIARELGATEFPLTAKVPSLNGATRVALDKILSINTDWLTQSRVTTGGSYAVRIVEESSLTDFFGRVYEINSVSEKRLATIDLRNMELRRDSVFPIVLIEDLDLGDVRLLTDQAASIWYANLVEDAAQRIYEIVNSIDGFGTNDDLIIK